MLDQLRLPRLPAPRAATPPARAKPALRSTDPKARARWLFTTAERYLNLLPTPRWRVPPPLPAEMMQSSPRASQVVTGGRPPAPADGPATRPPRPPPVPPAPIAQPAVRPPTAPRPAWHAPRPPSCDEPLWTVSRQPPSAVLAPSDARRRSWVARALFAGLVASVLLTGAGVDRDQLASRRAGRPAQAAAVQPAAAAPGPDLLGAPGEAMIPIEILPPPTALHPSLRDSLRHAGATAHEPARVDPVPARSRPRGPSRARTVDLADLLAAAADEPGATEQRPIGPRAISPDLLDDILAAGAVR